MNGSGMKYKDSSLPPAVRAQELLSRMDLNQKIAQITCLFTSGEGIPDFGSLIPDGIGSVGAMTIADSVEDIAEYSYQVQKHQVEHTEFGIPALLHVEAISGGMFTGATAFPSAIAQASTWDPEIVSRMTDTIREQMTAVGFRHALSPVLDISRDSRWGRLGETYGEDPTLAAAMGSAFVRGLQGQGREDAIIATGKHFIGHGASEGGLNMAQELVSERVLREVHCKPFQAAITEAGLMSVMNAYGMYNNEPIAASKYLLTDLLREEMGFDGMVVSDYISLDRLVDPFCRAADYREAGVLGLKAGIDVEFPRPTCYNEKLADAIAEGELAEADIDRAVLRVLTLKFRLGLFEDPYPRQHRISQVFSQGAGSSVSRKMAQEGLILLKNEHQTLPLSKKTKKIAVIGPHADSMRSFFGSFSYPGTLDMILTREEEDQTDPSDPHSVVNRLVQRFPGDIREISPRVEKRVRQSYPGCPTLLEAVKACLPEAEVVSAPGCNPAGTNLSGMEHALELAAQADVVILTLGGKYGWGTTSTVGEGVDATDIGLPGRQEEFARAVFALHKKTVLVHFDGRPLSSTYAASHFDAILEVWQPGQFGGEAIASVLFGDFNPAGRLSVTAARNAGQLPLYYSLPRGSGYISAGHPGMIENPNGYINDTARPLYCFGHGLSYTSFVYGKAELAAERIGPEETVVCTVPVTNTGGYDGEEVVQLYFSDPVCSMVRPEKELTGFRRIFLKKGETKKVTFRIAASQLAFLDENMKWKVEKGEYRLLAGASSEDIRSEAVFTVTCDAWVDGRTRGFYADTQISQ